MKRSSVIVGILALKLAAGCSSGGPTLYPVSGKITGATGSLEGVLVVLNPLDSKGLSAVGEVAADGTFKVESNNDRVGAMAGKYKVTLALGANAMKKAMEGMAVAGAKLQPVTSSSNAVPQIPGAVGMGVMTGPPKIEKPFPDSYSTPTTSPKDFEVKTGNNVLDIAF
jgi:hypothetical protein